jgi:Cys-rich protein (TIGR01571 family)
MKAPPPAGDFADTLCGGDPGPCGCCISDRRVGCVSVLVSWCIPGVVVAQLFQRVTRIPDSFAVIAIFLFGTTITNILLNSLCGDQSSLFGLPGLLTRPFWPSLCPVGQKCAPDNDGASGDDAEDGGRSDVCIFNDWLAFTSGLVLLSLFLVVRARVREQYRIAPCCCGVLEDCFHALWCLPCAASQLMRHVSTHEATEYSLFSADGTKTLDPPLRDTRGAEASPARAASIRAEASMRV